MNQESHNSLFLDRYRVLDVTDEKGFLAGKILGDLGADVIKVERPGGDPGRRTGPFLSDSPHPEKSLYWFTYNANKRGITLDIETSDGKDIFRRLVKTADIVIESFPPGYMSQIGLGYSELSEARQDIIMVSITPFGQTGPYKDYQASEITCWALGGLMHKTGDRDRPPVRISVPQAYLHGCSEAAATALTCLYVRETTGEGQHADVSIQQSLLETGYTSLWFWHAMQTITQREGSYRGGLDFRGRQRQIFECKDGFVIFYILGGASAAKSNQAITDWMNEEGMGDDYMTGMDWPNFDMSKCTQEQMDRMESSLSRFFLKRTKAELYSEAIKRRIGLCPANDPKTLLEDPQLRARAFWQEVEHPELNRSITYPGGFIKCSEVPITIRRRPPLIGEHNLEIYEELGLSREELVILKHGNVI
jgi:benzylsuccinate CoA-transferase BbsE subunit